MDRLPPLPHGQFYRVAELPGGGRRIEIRRLNPYYGSTLVTVLPDGADNHNTTSES